VLGSGLEPAEFGIWQVNHPGQLTPGGLRKPA
jgi:hypothetical protein